MSETYLTGALWASLAGLGFGVFQAFNRRARTGFSVYWATFILLFVSTLILATASLLTEDISILKEVQPSAYVNFALAGFIHFFLGWTFLTISQNRVGAARTGALVGATPLFSVFVAALAFEEYLSLPVLAGVFTVVAGVYFVSVSRKNGANPVATTWRDSLFGLGTALCFAISPIFIRGGLVALPSPLLGVTIGMAISALTYGLLLLYRREPLQQSAIPRDAIAFQLAAGVFVGLSTWARWIALGLTPVAVVLALGRMNVPVVIILSLLLVGQKAENVTRRIVFGATLIVIGSLMLIFFR
jgi:drug/metabolite transporter (DMT)-like permease